MFHVEHLLPVKGRLRDNGCPASSILAPDLAGHFIALQQKCHRKQRLANKQEMFHVEQSVLTLPNYAQPQYAAYAPPNQHLPALRPSLRTAFPPDNFPSRPAPSLPTAPAAF